MHPNNPTFQPNPDLLINCQMTSWISKPNPTYNYADKNCTTSTRKLVKSKRTRKYENLLAYFILFLRWGQRWGCSPRSLWRSVLILLIAWFRHLILSLLFQSVSEQILLLQILLPWKMSTIMKMNKNLFKLSNNNGKRLCKFRLQSLLQITYFHRKSLIFSIRVVAFQELTSDQFTRACWLKNIKSHIKVALIYLLF